MFIVNPFTGKMDSNGSPVDLSAYVPYTGATTDLDLGTHSLYTAYLQISNSQTNPASYSGIVNTALLNVTDSSGVSLDYTGYTSSLLLSVADGVTLTNTLYGSSYNAVRMGPDANTNGGRLTKLVGHLIGYGHSQNVANNPLTDLAVGFEIDPNIQEGTISDMRDLYLKSAITGGTATVHYSIYQEDSATRNFFAGDVYLDKLKASNGFVKTSGSTGLLTIDTNAYITDAPSDGSTYGRKNAAWLALSYFTLPALTNGSVLFSNGTTIAQNNAKFSWDDANFTLNIGDTKGTGYALYVSPNATSMAGIFVTTAQNYTGIYSENAWNGRGGWFKSYLSTALEATANDGYGLYVWRNSGRVEAATNYLGYFIDNSTGSPADVLRIKGLGTGPLLTAYDNTTLVFSVEDGGAVKVANLTAGRVTFATTGGQLTDVSGFTYNSSTTVLAVPRITMTNTDTDVSSVMQTNSYSHVCTASAAKNGTNLSAACYAIVNTGVNNTGQVAGLVFNGFRNYSGVNTNDSGTLTSLIANEAASGHYDQTKTNYPTTGNVYIYYAYPYIRSGVITNLYSMYLRTANTISTPADWAATTAYALNAYVKPTVATGYYYVCSRAGTSGGTEPVWPTSNGTTIDDPDVNGAQWTCVIIPAITNRWGLYSEDVAAKNYVGGKLFVGLTAGSYRFQLYDASTDSYAAYYNKVSADMSLACTMSVNLTVEPTQDRSTYSGYGLAFSAQNATNSAYDWGSLYGIQGSTVNNGGSNCNITYMYGGKFGCLVAANKSPGTTTAMYGIQAYNQSGASAGGTITNSYCLQLGGFVKGSSSTTTVTNDYGILINDVSSGATLNYAIYTNAGDVHFGDDVDLAEGKNLIFGTTTGTKIGTATSQKIGFWNAAPIVQPTTAIAEASFTENAGGLVVNVDSTFGGYTLQQVVKALQNAGLLA